MTMAEAPYLLVAAIVIIIEWVLPIPTQYSPFQLSAALAAALEKKVNKPGEDQQQLISGFMSLLTYLVLLLIIIWAILFIMPDDYLTDAVILYLCLAYQPVANLNKRIADAISAKQKNLAKSYLARRVPFDTQPLSPLGIIKASLELEISKFVRGWLIPIVLFLSLGVLATVIYRLICIASEQWPALSPKFGLFGRAAAAALSIIEWPFVLVLAPIYSIFKSSPGWLSLFNEHKSAWPLLCNRVDLLWYVIVSSGLKVEVAGPQLYAGVKVTRSRINSGERPNESHVKQLRSWNLRVQLFVLILLSGFWCLANFTG